MRPKPREVESTTAVGRGMHTSSSSLPNSIHVQVRFVSDAPEQVALQKESRDLAPSGDHSDPDMDRSLLAVLEKIVDRMGPTAALRNPLPFATLMQMLQRHMTDLDQAYLRKLFNQCDTNQVHIDYVYYHVVCC